MPIVLLSGTAATILANSIDYPLDSHSQTLSQLDLTYLYLCHIFHYYDTLNEPITLLYRLTLSYLLLLLRRE